MDLIFLTLKNNSGGGNIVLDNIISVLKKNKKFKVFKINLFENNSIFSFSYKSFISLFKRNFIKKNCKIIYSEPLISIFIFLFFNRISSIRYSQGDDLNLYVTNNNFPKYISQFISQFIKFSLKKNKSFTIANSRFTQKINISQNHKVEKVIYPFIKIPHEIDKPLIISIQAHKNQKNLKEFIKIFENFKDEYNFLIISRINIDVPKGMGILIPNNNSILFFVLKHAFAHISTSKIESFGLPIYESMILNVPSIVYPNNSFHINEDIKNLLYVKDSSLESLKIILDDLKINSYRDQVINNQRTIINKYSESKFQNSFNDLFDSMIL